MYRPVVQEKMGAVVISPVVHWHRGSAGSFVFNGECYRNLWNCSGPGYATFHSLDWLGVIALFQIRRAKKLDFLK